MCCARSAGSHNALGCVEPIKSFKSTNPVEIGQEMSYNKMKSKSYRKHFTSDLANKDENNKFRICKLAKKNENKQTHNILKKQYYMHAQYSTLGLSRTLNTSEDNVGIFTMYQVIPRVCVLATMVDLHFPQNMYLICFYPKIAFVV